MLFADDRAVSIYDSRSAQGEGQLCLFLSRFAPLLQKNATLEDPSRVIVTASVAGLGVGSLGDNATFGYSASKGTSHPETHNSLMLTFD